MANGDRQDLLDNLQLLAKAARLFSVPVILTAVESKGFSGEIAPQLLELFPDQTPIERSSMNAWDNPAFVAAVKSTGRRNFLLAALWSEACLAFPALQMLEEGYGVYAVKDASRGTSPAAQETALRRVEQAGGVSLTALQVLLEFQRDWARTEHYDEVMAIVKERCGGIEPTGPTPRPGGSQRSRRAPTQGQSTNSTTKGNQQMNTITTKDGTQIYYRDWGSGRPVVFSHGWPLSGDAFEDQMFFLASRGYRCIAHDRRGHGHSSQPWQGNDMDTYADDLATLVTKLDLKDAIHVGHSTGGGEVVRYIARHGTRRVAKVVLIGAVPPLMLKTAANPGGLPMEVFDQIRAGVAADRSQFFMDLTMPFYGYNRPGAKVSQGVRDSFWQQGMMAGFPACYFCIKAFSETDQTEDLKKIDVPTLILHGDDDQIVPIANSAMLSAKLVKEATLKVYKGAPHGMCTTHMDQVNDDLLDFMTEAQQTLRKAA